MRSHPLPPNGVDIYELQVQSRLREMSEKGYNWTSSSADIQLADCQTGGWCNETSLRRNLVLVSF